MTTKKRKKKHTLGRAHHNCGEGIPERVPNSYTVSALCVGEDRESLPPVDEKFVTWFRVATNPPLSKVQIDDMSHLMCDLLVANGISDGFARVVQDHELYERGEVDLLKWLAVRRGQSYEDRMKDYPDGI